MGMSVSDSQNSKGIGGNFKMKNPTAKELTKIAFEILNIGRDIEERKGELDDIRVRMRTQLTAYATQMLKNNVFDFETTPENPNEISYINSEYERR